MLHFSLIQNAEEEEDFAIVTLQDVTNRKQLERALHQRNKELKSSNEYLDNFVYAVAHDLRAPIANLKQMSEFILMLNEDTEDPVYEKLKISVNRLDRTASGLIKIIDAQKVEGLQIQRVSLTEKLEMIQGEMEAKIKQLKAHFKLDITADSINYFEPYLEIILRNLIQNALKYSHPNRAPLIIIKSWEEGEFLVLSIQDNGIGIDLEKAGNRLFRPFKRFTNRASGHGIGLHLIKSMVEKNGGKIKLTSKLEIGCTFNIYLKSYEFNT